MRTMSGRRSKSDYLEAMPPFLPAEKLVQKVERGSDESEPAERAAA